MSQPEDWWKNTAERGRDLLNDISAAAQRARAAGFETTAYILDLAIVELRKEVDMEEGRAQE